MDQTLSPNRYPLLKRVSTAFIPDLFVQCFSAVSCIGFSSFPHIDNFNWYLSNNFLFTYLLNFCYFIHLYVFLYDLYIFLFEILLWFLFEIKINQFSLLDVIDFNNDILGIVGGIWPRGFGNVIMYRRFIDMWWKVFIFIFDPKPMFHSFEFSAAAIRKCRNVGKIIINNLMKTSCSWQ